ncbi:putative secreted protein [Neofusicoccum parvum UCRNP2]|uniref:Putative secreted protein n=1 Tax=Botryosphaeria parva (strain UCR-NP2) TaxID=1287680 RepID=R1FXJ7_BOTPV|nr:putative secreted protein [Neofusicoccum parvum UCRNP2]
MQLLLAVSALLSAAPLLTQALPAPAPVPTPPGIPTASTARSQLNSLTVAARGSSDGYSRDEFNHWITISGSVLSQEFPKTAWLTLSSTCNTRETVLKRDGTNVVTSSACAATSGSWFSPYDGATWTAASDVDIDHMVPLSNAWQSGASSWTAAQRQAFANDLDNPQLWAVTDNVNSSKGDKSPDAWKPPLSSFYCVYARSWVKVKSVYDLTITSAEKTALTSMLDTC